MHPWDDKLWLLKPSEFDELPDGTELVSITGENVIKGKDYIDDDTRWGHMAYGIVDPAKHPLSELFTWMILAR